MSMDLRLRIVRAVDDGSSIREAARRFAVSPSAAIKLMQRVRTTGSAAPDRYGGDRRPLLEPYETDLRKLVEAAPDVTLAELQAELERRFGIVAGLTTIHNALRRLGLRHKKIAESRRAGPPRRRPPAPALAGLATLHGRCAVRVSRRDGDRHQHGAPLRPQPLRRALGRRRATRPLADHDVHCRPAAERHRGAAGPRGPMTGPAFRAYVEQFLAPALAPGDVVVLDNLAAHKVEGVRQAIAAAGASVLYLPPTAPI
jgi:transposase